MKKFLSLVVILVFIMSFCGCKGNILENFSNNATKGQKTFDLVAITMDKIYTLNDKNEKLSEFDYSTYEGTYVGKNENNIVLAKYETSKNNNFDGIYIFYKVDIKTSKIEELYKTSEYNYADVYNGKLYVVSYDRYEEKYVENCVDINTLESKITNKEFYDEIKGYTYEFFVEGIRCVDYYMDNYGYVIIEKDGDVFTYDRNGYVKIKFDNYLNYILCADKENIFYSGSIKEYEDQQIYVYNLKEKKAKLVSDKFNTYLKTGKDAIYWVDIDDSDYGRDNYNVYTCQKKDLNPVLITSVKKNPGMQGYNPLLADFTIVDDKIYFLANDGMRKAWYYADANKKSDAKATDIVLSASDFIKYGKIDLVNTSVKCPFCGNLVGKYYSEYLIMDANYNKNYQALNDIFKNDAENTIRECEITKLNSCTSASWCEDHKDPRLIETNEIYVDEISEFKSHYLVINYSGYWYGGGAHGYPSFSSKLYDLRTGKEIKFKDLYKGSEENLKKLVATKTKEDYKKYDYYDSPYMAQDEETVYAEAYNYVSIDTLLVSFKEDKIVVMYPPYQMGPYAAGYITIDITYDELGISLD